MTPIHIPAGSPGSSSSGSSSLQIGRLILGPPLQSTEPTGDPVASLGGAVVPAQRTAPQWQLQLATWAADGNPDSLASRLTLRRQLRSLVNNSALKFQAFLYVVWSDDTEQDGWYAPDQGPLADMTAPMGLATGLWQLSQAWLKQGARRTHREARSVWMKDLRTGLFQRDQLGWVYSADFAALPALQLSVVPHGATSVANSVSGQLAAPVTLPAGRDGGVCGLCSGQADLTVLSYERAATAENLSDVIVYDRRGNIGPFGSIYDSAAGLLNPQSAYGWEEAYGPDYPWSWLNQGGTADAPVVENGLVRVRYDSANTPGFRIDVWNGSTYSEQGKMTVERTDGFAFDDTWISASLVEYTPERAVVLVVLAASSVAASRERVYITVQRGELGASFEVYPAPTNAGAQSAARLVWTPALNNGVADLNQSVAKIDSQGSGSWVPGGAGNGKYAATAGSGAGAGHSGLYAGALTTLGNANFTTSENWVAILRCPTAYNVIGPYQHTLVVLQAANSALEYRSANTAYGTTTDEYFVESQNSAGYVQCQVQFSPTQADQIMEAESMTLGTNWSSVADTASSGGNAAKTTQTSDVGALSRATWPNGFLGTYRIFIRAKSTVNATVYAQATGQATPVGDPVTIVGQATPTYSWYDVGELVANNVTLSLHGWCNTAGFLMIDRVEAVLVQDRARTAAIFSGSRDAAQAALQDSRALGSLVAR